MFRIRGDFDCDTVSLAHGRYVLFIETAETPASVWFQIEEDAECGCSLPICGGSTTLLGASIVENGFWLFADVRANACQIHWFISEY
jgi:hypothetical protein